MPHVLGRGARIATAMALSTALLLLTGLPAAAGDPSAAQDQAGAGSRLQRVAYYAQWKVYSGFFIKNIAGSGAAQRLTTVNYAFGNVDATGKCASIDPWADYQRPAQPSESVDGNLQPGGNFNQLRLLKQRYPNLRVLISLGGFSLSNHFSQAVSSAASRQALVASCIDLFINGNLPGSPGALAGTFDGFDLDWEWPTLQPFNGGTGSFSHADRHNFTLLLAEFRSQLNRLGESTDKRYLLTAFLPADPVKIGQGFEVPKIFRYLDWGTVQGYDLHGAWESTTNHQSALFAPAGDPSAEKFSDDLAIRTYLAHQAPARKLVLGVPFYSHAWTNVTGGTNGLFGTGVQSSAYDQQGYNVVKDLLGAGYSLHRDSSVGTAWLWNGTTFVNFDDSVAIGQKMNYVLENELGGAMAWELSGDDAAGSLVKAMADGLAQEDQTGNH
jgi:chitinase